MERKARGMKWTMTKVAGELDGRGQGGDRLKDVGKESAGQTNDT